MYSDIELLNQLVFKPCELHLTTIEAELESKEYDAHTFELNGLKIKFRKAKVTPTKTGQFVSIWKRNKLGITEPFNLHDNIDFYIIAARNKEQFGVFIFPKLVLHEHHILSDATRDGKRGIRVYPTWDITTNKQAQKTQLWQTTYFIELNAHKQVDLMKVKSILNIKSKNTATLMVS